MIRSVRNHYYNNNWQFAHLQISNTNMRFQWKQIKRNWSKWIYNKYISQSKKLLNELPEMELRRTNEKHSLSRKVRELRANAHMYVRCVYWLLVHVKQVNFNNVLSIFFFIHFEQNKWYSITEAATPATPIICRIFFSRLSPPNTMLLLWDHYSYT